MTEKQQKNNQVITIDQIQEKAKGVIVEIPDWEPRKKISVRLRAIDITPHLMETGAIPDELSVEVATMFGDEKVAQAKQQEKQQEKPEEYKIRMEKFMPLLNAIAKEALVEPTYDEIQKIYPLTLAQKMTIFQHVMAGIDKMKPFRK